MFINKFIKNIFKTLNRLNYILKNTKVNIMIKEIKTTKEISVKYKYCDVCGDEIKIGMACSVARCTMCKIDLCDRCVGKENYTGGDYREVYCKQCWDIGEPYRKLIQEHEKAIDELNDDWLKKCKTKKGEL